MASSLLSWATIALVSLCVLTYFRIIKAISYSGNFPRLGNPGLVGYIKTAMEFSLRDPRPLLRHGSEEFRGRPYVMPTLLGPQLVVGPEHADKVRGSPDRIMVQTFDQELMFPYTMNDEQLRNPYHATVVRKAMTSMIPDQILEVVEETALTLDEAFKPSGGAKFAEVPVLDTMTHAVARISNCVILGTELGRNDAFIDDIVRFAESFMVMAPLLTSCWPEFLRFPLYKLMEHLIGGKKQALRHIMPHLTRYLEERQQGLLKPHLLMEPMIKAAPPSDKPEDIAIRLMSVNFGAIHTSSIFLSQVLYELALLPKSDVDDLRVEIMTALEAEGGWNRRALARMVKVDSALREVGRVQGLLFLGVSRRALVPVDLGDGMVIAPGARVVIDLRRMHFDREVYGEDADEMDLFRFAKKLERLNDGPVTDSGKYSLSAVDKDYLVFGAGRHVCAGRKFAQMELKIMLAHILLNYDISYPDGVDKRPADVLFNGFIFPDPKQKMRFTRRVVA